MGTPDFAVPSLRALLADGHRVAGVFTQPDRPRGRGHAVTFSPVKELAAAHGIPVFQPETFRDGAAAETLRALAPDLIAVVAYGRILPRSVLEIPPVGCVNLHASLLPKYRGAAPIQWAVVNGETETGVTTMHMAPSLDSGDIIYAESVSIGPDETAAALQERLMLLGASLLARTVRSLAEGAAPRTPQDDAGASFAPLLRREDGRIDWRAGARQVCCLVRGMQPWPLARAGREAWKIYAARETGRRGDGAPGDVVGVGPAGLEVLCGDGYTVLVTELQAGGSRRMAAADYARGHAVPPSLRGGEEGKP
jgi:methionyl-tRNA formyltransferase